MPAPSLFSNRLYQAGTLLLVIIASGLIFFSSRKQSLTIDESNHLYCGMEWLQEGTYTAWPENPPLSRAIVALGPYLKGFRLQPPAGEQTVAWVPSTAEGKQPSLFEYFLASYNFDYFYTGPIRQTLLWLRIIILPIFLLSVGIVWLWARSLGGHLAAFLAVGMYCTLPPILAHSGLATTDITFVTFFTLLMFCFSRWVKRPTVKRGILLGLSMGTALLIKFSVMAFFPPAALLLLILYYVYGLKEQSQEPKQWGLSLFKSGTLAAVISFLCVWAFFGFSVGRLADEPTIQAAIQEGAIPASQGELVFPAPEWFAGVRLLMHHNDSGQAAYAAGSISMQGFWFYYPLTVLIKTPWPFLLFLLLGAVGAWLPREDKPNWEVVALSLIPFIILLGGLSSNINIGMRHILVIYPLGAIGASAGVLQLLKYFFPKKPLWKTVLPTGLVLWQLGIAAVAYPMYLSYFNPIAGEEPGELLVDSDLDWGQGMFELAEFCRDNKVERISISCFGTGVDCWYGLPALQMLHPDSATSGWVAVSEMAYRGVFGGTVNPMGSCNFLSIMPIFDDKLQVNKGYRWLDKYPLKAKLGGSIRVYYVGEAAGTQDPTTLKGTVK